MSKLSTKEQISILQNYITKCESSVDRAKKMLDQLYQQLRYNESRYDQPKNKFTVRLHGVYQFKNGVIGYCYQVNKDTAVLFVGGVYNDIIVRLDGKHFGYRTRSGTNLVAYVKEEKWSIRRTYKKKYDKEKENGKE